MDNLNTSYVLRSGRSHIGLREQNTWNEVHMSALPRNCWPAAFPTCSMRYCGIARVWISGLVPSGYRIWSLWLFMSQWFGIQTMVWASVASGLANHSPECMMCVNQNRSLWNTPPHSLASWVSQTEPTPFQEGIFNTLKLQASSQGCCKIRQSTHLSFLMTVDTANTLALAPGTTLPGSTPWEGGLVLIHLWKSHLK